MIEKKTRNEETVIIILLRKQRANFVYQKFFGIFGRKLFISKYF